jgi:hypothetical protein
MQFRGEMFRLQTDYFPSLIERSITNHPADQ